MIILLRNIQMLDFYCRMSASSCGSILSVSIIPLKQSLPLMTLSTAAGLACSQHMRIDLKKITFGLMDQKFI